MTSSSGNTTTDGLGASGPSQDGLAGRRHVIAVTALLLAIVMTMGDGAIMTVALPTIRRDLGISDSLAIWLINAYQLVIAISILPAVALGETMGFRRVFTLGTIVFVAGAAVSATSGTWTMLMCGRLIQSLGAAAVLGTMPPLLRFSYPASRIGRGIGYNALTVGLSSAAGPTIGAAILTVTGWHMLFLLSIPVGLATLWASRQLPEIPRGPQRLSLASLVLSVTALTMLVLAGEFSASDGRIGAGLFGIGLGLGWLLVRYEKRRSLPLVPVDLLSHAPLSAAAMASSCLFAAQMIALIALPFYLTRNLGLDTLGMGLMLTLWPVSIAMTAPFAGRLADRAATSRLAAIGSGFLAGSVAILAILDRPPEILTVVLIALAGIGFGFFQTPNNRAIIMGAPKSRSGGAGAIQALARQLGMSLGAALAAGVFSRAVTGDGKAALGLAACLAAIACGLSVWRGRYLEATEK